MTAALPFEALARAAAPLTEAQARAVIKAAGCRLVETSTGPVASDGFTVKAWGRDVAAVATMLREKVAAEEAWHREAAQRFAAGHARAKAILQAVEEAAR